MQPDGYRFPVVPLVGPENADIILKSLLEVRDMNGTLENRRIRAAAESLGVDRSTLRRWVANGKVSKGKKVPWKLSERDIEAYFETFGYGAAAWRMRKKEEAPDKFVSYQTFARAIERDLTPQERSVAREGQNGFAKYRLCWTVDYKKKNQVLAIDSKQLDILVQPPNLKEEPRHPWLTTALWSAVGAIGAYSMTLDQPNQFNVADVLYRAMRGDPELGPFCGIPDAIRSDSGAENTADLIEGIALKLQIASHITNGGAPNQNGAIERLHGTYDTEFQIGFPHNRLGPKKGRGIPEGPTGVFVPYEFLLEDFHRFVIDFNRDRARTKKAGSPTPEEAWLNDPSPIRQLDPSVARHILLRDIEKTVYRPGINHVGLTYWTPELAGIVGEKVIVYYGEDPRSVEVYLDGAWRCTAFPTDLATEEEMDEMFELNKVAEQRARKENKKRNRKHKAKYTSQSAPGKPKVKNPLSKDEVARATRAAGRKKQRSNDEMVKLLGIGPTPK